MKLSKHTIDIFKNFASINQNLLIHPGNMIDTRTVAKNIYVQATVDDVFEQEFGVYNLAELLGVISLFSDPDLVFSDNSMTISQGKNTVQYVFASPEVLDYPEKAVTLPVVDAKFELPEETLRSLLKAGSVLSATDLLIQGADSVIKCTVLDPKNPSSNTFTTEVGDTDMEFSCYHRLEYLKMIPGIYQVDLSSKKKTRFVNKAFDYNFYIAAEKSSTWN